MDALEPLKNRFVRRRNQPAFWGRGWSFPPAFNRIDRRQEIVEGDADIHQSLIILLSTLPGERKLQPHYGIDLSELQFEPLTIELSTQMKDRITMGILENEPRIILEEIDLVPVPGKALVEIVLDYTIVPTNNRTNLVYPFFLKEGTDL